MLNIVDNESLSETVSVQEGDNSKVICDLGQVFSTILLLHPPISVVHY